MSEGIIYGLCGPEGIRYVGQTRMTLRKRFYHHARAAEKGWPQYVYKWWRSLPDPPFAVILEECPIDLLNERERAWISELRAADVRLTNQTDGGEGGSPDAATREKLRQAATGKSLSPEARAKLSKHFKGRTFSPEHRKKLSAAQIGRKISPEHREKLIQARRKRAPHSAETRAKMSATQKRIAQDPEWRERVSRGTKAGIARAKADGRRS